MDAEQPGTIVVLKDGSKVLIDQVHREDARLLAEGFARLSMESRQLRFLTAKPRLTAAEIEYFTHIDHHDHEALGALDVSDGRGVGVARFIRDPKDSQVAEIAVTVVDDWQGRGLGTELLTRLMERAREEGIERFTALVDAENELMVSLLHDIGGDLHIADSGAGVVDYQLTPAGGTPSQMHQLLRAFGRRQIRAPGRFADALNAMVPERPRRQTAPTADPPAVRSRRPRRDTP